MPLANRNSKCGSENDARHSHIPEEQNITNHKVEALEHKALSLHIPHLKDENIFGTREKAWSQTKAPTQTQLQQTQPQPSTNAHPQNTNPMTRKAPGPKASDKRKRTMLAKRRYKVRVLTQPIPSSPTLTAPTPTVATTSTQMPVTRSTGTESIPITVYKLATGKFAEVPYPTARPQNEGHPSIQGSNPPPQEDIPNTPVRQGTLCPSAGLASEDLFETRKDWPIPPTPTPTPAPTVKTEVPPQVAVIPYAKVIPKQVAERCSWGQHCPICKNEEEHVEDWDDDRNKDQPRMHPQNTQQHQPQNT